MKTYLALAAVASLALSAPAGAVPYFFELTGDYSASWTLDSSPTPDSFDAISFVVWDVTGSFPGSAFDVVDLRFWLGTALGGMTIIDFFGGGVTLIDSSGGQLFSGSLEAPTFLLGSFDLEDFDGREYLLVISDQPGGPGGIIPEPATWAMMIAGFGLVGFAARRRRNAIA